ncbi:MAG: redoxin family protein [Nitratireductor sp.]
MKTLAALLVAGFLIGAPSANAADGHAQTLPLHETPQTLPDLTFADGDGASRALTDWRGKIVLLNIWATWCGPCRAEMPTLDRLQQRLGDDRFEVVALSVDRAGPAVVHRFYEETGIKALRLYIDQAGQALRTLGIVGLPTTLLIGADGRELGRLVGPAEWDAPEIAALIEAHIQQRGVRN